MQFNPRMTLKLPSGMNVSGLAFSPDGTLLASASKQVYLWDAETGTKRSVLRGHERGVTAVLFLVDGTLVSADWFGIRFWDLGLGKQVSCIPFGGWITGLAASQDGRTQLTSTAASLHLWDVASKMQVGSAMLAGDCWSIDFDPNRSSFACSRGGTIEIWTPEPFQLAYVLGRLGQKGLTVTYSPKDKVLAAGGVFGSIKVWKVATKKEVSHIPDAHKNFARTVCFSPDGHLLASGGADGLVKLWDWKSGKELARDSVATTVRPRKTNPPAVNCVSFSPSGRMLAGGGSNPGHLRLWDIGGNLK